MKFNWFFILFISVYNLVNAQLVTSTFEEINSFKEKRPVVVFLHADWCKPCAIMEATTFKNNEVINKLNKDYYFISFDVESEEEIKFKNKIYKNNSSGRKKGAHELAQTLGRYHSKLRYPTIVVLDTKKEIVFQHPAKLKAKGFLRLLNSIEQNETL